MGASTQFVAQSSTYSHENLYYLLWINNVKILQYNQNSDAGVGINLSPVLVSEPGSVGDLCTTDRVPKKFHLSPPPPPSFPPMSVLGLRLLSSGVARKGAGLCWNQVLHFPKQKQHMNIKVHMERYAIWHLIWALLGNIALGVPVPPPFNITFWIWV